MTLLNLILIVLVLGIAGVIIYFYVNSKKNEEVVTRNRCRRPNIYISKND